MYMQIEHVSAPSYFVYDLEFIGDVRIPASCRIWDLAVYSVSSGEMFSAVVDPDPARMDFPAPPIPECFPVTRAFLNRHRAKIFPSILDKLIRWVAHRSYGKTPILMSHNNFRTDKRILVAEATRAHLVLPLTWYFFDTLLYARDRYPKLGEYSMHRLMRHVGINTSVSHRAVQDTMDLFHVLHHMSEDFTALTGEITDAQTTSLRCVPGIGRAVQGRFYAAGFHSLEAVQAYVHSLQEMALHVGVPPRAYVIRWLGSILHGIAVPVIMRVQRAVLP